jgi:hypothetical protein
MVLGMMNLSTFDYSMKPTNRHPQHVLEESSLILLPLAGLAKMGRPLLPGLHEVSAGGELHETPKTPTTISDSRAAKSTYVHGLSILSKGYDAASVVVD